MLPSMWAHHNKKGRGVAKNKIREEDEVAIHRRYANLARCLDMLSLRNIGFGNQATHETHRGALGQSPEERCSLKKQTLGGKLAHLEWT